MKNFFRFATILTLIFASLSSSAEGTADAEKILQRANSGEANAQFELGSCYAAGALGLKKDINEALKWLTLAAEQNHAKAQSYLGIILASGATGKRDIAKAQTWRELAAKNGDATEKWTLGNAYLFGYLVPRDHARALHWIEEAAKLDHPDALAKVIDLYEKLQAVAKTDAELQAYTQKVDYWKKHFSNLELKSAENGNPIAMNAVARKFLKGTDGLPRNIIKAIYWHKKAADKGNLSSIETLAKMYARGRYVTKNPERAREYFLKIAEKDPNYSLKISSLYATGKDGFPKDAEQSLYWLERAAENLDDSTKLYLAWRYWSGTNAPKDSKRALLWCEKASSDAARQMKQDIANTLPAPASPAKYLITPNK